MQSQTLSAPGIFFPNPQGGGYFQNFSGQGGVYPPTPLFPTPGSYMYTALHYCVQPVIDIHTWNIRI